MSYAKDCFWTLLLAVLLIFQHADHFIRIIEEQEKNKPVKNLENSENSELKKNNIEDDQDKAKKIINNKIILYLK